MSTIVLIFKIASILISCGPEVYKIWCEIMAAIPKTPETGNDTSVEVAKATAKAIIPVLPQSKADELQRVLDEHSMYQQDATPEQLAAMQTAP